MDTISSINFDKRLGKTLKNPIGKKIVRGKFDIENIGISKKIEFIKSFFLSSNNSKAVTFKILFWEKDGVMCDFFKVNFPDKQYKITTSYRNGKLPGIIYLDDTKIDDHFLSLLLINHFNHEMAKLPSLNLRAQICVNHDAFIIVLDIYDDRGFNFYQISL